MNERRLCTHDSYSLKRVHSNPKEQGQSLPAAERRPVRDRGQALEAVLERDDEANEHEGVRYAGEEWKSAEISHADVRKERDENKRFVHANVPSHASVVLDHLNTAPALQPSNLLWRWHCYSVSFVQDRKNTHTIINQSNETVANELLQDVQKFIY